MKVLQALIISLFIFGCSNVSPTAEPGIDGIGASSSSGDGDSGHIPGNDPMVDGNDQCTTVCPAGSPGVDGANGSSCSVQQSGTSATVSCTDGTNATLLGGAQGPAGPMGVAGPAGPKGDTGTTGATGSTGATGPQGPAGPKGDTGAKGADGLLKASSVYVRTHYQATSAQALCDDGDVATGGGCDAGTVGIRYSSPLYDPENNGEYDGEFAADGDTPNGWACRTSDMTYITARVICVDVTP
jgi:hypothetical protein